MKFFFDTEFIDDGKSIELISIGMVSKSDDPTKPSREFYAVSAEARLDLAGPWVREHVLSSRWRSAWASVGVAPKMIEQELRGVFDLVLEEYAHPERHYHTAAHLDACFDVFDSVRATCERPGEVELALFFHDLVYDTTASNNEWQSADHLVAVATAVGVSTEIGARLRELVLATRHTAAVPSTRDGCVLADVDLAILGAEPERFDAYEREVRQEYKHVSDEVFWHWRGLLLRGLLGRLRLYRTDELADRFEEAARTNLARSLVRHGPPGEG